MRSRRNRKTHRRQRGPVVVAIWCGMLLTTGVTRHWVNSATSTAAAGSVGPETPLSELPMHIGPWRGTDVALDQRIVEVAGADDHINRRYVNEGTHETVDLYIAYTTQPATMLGHRPQVCYPANGWQSQSTRVVRIVLPDHEEVPCMIHRFSGPTPDDSGLIVLNYYLLQGRHTTEWTDFWGPRWRGPNAAHDPGFYVAQVQIAGAVLIPGMNRRANESVRRFAAEVIPRVRAILPSAAGLTRRPPNAGG